MRARDKIFLAAFFAAFLLLGAGLLFFSFPVPADLEVSFFDVGQGDAALIESPYGQNILIDGGPDNTVIRRLSEELPFWDRTIDLMVLTHPHDDHLFGLNEVLERYQVRRAVYSGTESGNPAFARWLDLLKEQDARLLLARQGQPVKLGPDCWLEFLYPADDVVLPQLDPNNASVVSCLDCLGKRFLFTGDIEKEVEEELVSSGLGLEADYLKTSHHGSDTSSIKSFLEEVDPAVAFIPVGADNDFGFPSRRVELRLKRQGARIHRADQHGTLKVVVSRSK